MRYFIKSLALLFLLLASPVLAGGINNGGGSGSGITSVPLGAGLTITKGTANATPLIAGSSLFLQTYPAYFTSGTTIVAGQAGGLVTYNSASPGTFALPQAGTTGFEAGTAFNFSNMSTGALTISTTTSVFNGVPLTSSNIVLAQNANASCTSDGTNWDCLSSSPSTSSQWTTTGSDIYYTTGKVGIGTTAPANGIDVRGTVNVMANIQSSNTTATSITLNNTSTGGHSYSFGSVGQVGAGTGCWSVGDNTAANNPFAVCGTGKLAAILQAGVLAWSTAATFVTATVDTGISRDSAGVIDIGNGTAGNKSGAINATTSTMTGISTAASFVPSGSTVATNGMYLSAANTLDFSTNSTKQIEVSSAGAVSMPNLATSSAAQTGTVCSGTGGLFTVDTTTTCLLSLEELKDKIGPINDALGIVNKLEPFWFSWKKGTPEYVGDKAVQPGLGAHQVAKVAPRLAAYNPDGTLHGVRYQELTAVLVKAIQEQQKEIDDLKSRIKE